jgi:hypothetical protein
VSRARLILALAAVAATPSFAMAHAPPAAASGPPAASIGSGANQVWLLRPHGPVRDIVVFAHGWSTPLPSAWGPWLAHLRAGGSLIVYPRYLSGRGDTTQTAMIAFRSGVTTAFRRLRGLRVPILALGKSFGGAAVFAYAAQAGSWGVPPPQAVVSIFPAYPAGPLAAPPAPGIFTEILVGDADTVAGSGGANAFWRWLAPHPAASKRYVTIRSHAGFSATHDSPQLATPAARAAYWRLVDGVLARIRRSGR